MVKKYLNWEYIELAVTTLAHQITASNLRITHIKGIPRGGLIPATMLSHKLGIPMLESDLGRIDEHVLIVDEICDSGKTLEYYYHCGCPIATIHYKKTASITPNFVFESVDTEWIVYPWEKSDAPTVPDYTVGGNADLKEF